MIDGYQSGKKLYAVADFIQHRRRTVVRALRQSEAVNRVWSGTTGGRESIRPARSADTAVAIDAACRSGPIGASRRCRSPRRAVGIGTRPHIGGHSQLRLRQINRSHERAAQQSSIAVGHNLATGVGPCWSARWYRATDKRTGRARNAACHVIGGSAEPRHVASGGRGKPRRCGHLRTGAIGQG